MAEQIQKARMQQKRDITTNWQMASNFVPKSGEIIIYGDKEKDKYLDPTTPSRIKVGDGVTPVSELPGISGELYVQEQEPLNAGEGALWVSPDSTQINPGISAVSDWNASEKDVGYIKNKPVEVIQTYVTLNNNEELMQTEGYFGASDNFYYYKNMENIELVLEGLEDYKLIEQPFGSFLDLSLYMKQHAAEFETEHLIAFCSASFLGMSLSSLAILHILLTLEEEKEEEGGEGGEGSSSSSGSNPSPEDYVSAVNYQVLMISNDVEVGWGEGSLPIGTHFLLDKVEGVYISSLKFNYNAAQIPTRYQSYFKDEQAVNVYSLGTIEDWAGVMLGVVNGDSTEEAMLLAKKTLFAELAKYKRGDVLLVPSIVFMLFEGEGALV